MKRRRNSAFCTRQASNVGPSHCRRGGSAAASPGFSHCRRGGRVAASPAFSGPRSRGTTADHQRQPRQHLGAPTPSPTPRMGPAPAGATATLQAPPWTLTHGGHGGAGAGGSGMRAQAPFAVSKAVTNHGGVDEVTLRGPRWLPASVGRSTHARAACPRLALGARAARMDSKLTFNDPARFMRPGSREARWSNGSGSAGLGWSADAADDRQLRQLHLQPGAVLR